MAIAQTDIVGEHAYHETTRGTICLWPATQPVPPAWGLYRPTVRMLGVFNDVIVYDSQRGAPCGFVYIQKVV